MSHAAQFVFSHQGEVLARFELDPGVYVIGSDESCEVVIDLEGMQPRHARLFIDEEGVRLEDLESGSGTFVAGARITKPMRLPGQAAVTFGSCVGELRMDAPAVPSRHLRPRRKRKPRRLAPEDPGWEIWPQEPAPPRENGAAAELRGRLEDQEAELKKLRDENRGLLEASRMARDSVQEKLSLLKVANRALLKKLSQAAAPVDERESLRRELKQREKALVEAWAGRQAADERNSELTRKIAEAGATPVPRRNSASARLTPSPVASSSLPSAPDAPPSLPSRLLWLLLASFVAVALLAGLLLFTTKRARRAELVVAQMRASAPQYLNESRALLVKGELEPALAKIDCALALRNWEPDYYLERGYVCESLFRFAPAIAAFESALNLRPGDRAARQNLDLCQSLATSRNGLDSPETSYALHRLMLAQGRLPEALRMAQRLPNDRALFRLTWQAILDAAGLHTQLDLNPDGTFDLTITAAGRLDLALLHGLPLRRLSLHQCGVSDLAPLHENALRELDVSGNPLRELTPLGGLPLELLDLADTEVTSLSPLNGMPLHTLVLDRTPISDLAALRGMRLQHLSVAGTLVWNLQPLADLPLRTLDLSRTRVSDLTPLHLLPLTALRLEGTNVLNLGPLEGLPLTALNVSRTGIRTLEPLRKAALRELWLGGCSRLENIDALATQTGLEKLTLPPQCKKLDVLRPLPALRSIAYDPEGQSTVALQNATDFWHAHGYPAAAVTAIP